MECTEDQEVYMKVGDFSSRKVDESLGESISPPLNVASCSMADLFSSKLLAGEYGRIVGSLQIPDYQRPYTWGRGELNRLITDLKNYFRSKNEHNYFLGSLVLHEDRENGHLNIIDGQQRLTSLAILANLLGRKVPEIGYSSPTSHRQIFLNHQYLATLLREGDLPDINFENINVTLVVTQSEDDAYRFFETQNTGGIRLTGADIIKAHHLRASEKNVQNDYARRWEAMGELSPIIDCVLKVRYWQGLGFRYMPSHRNPVRTKEAIVSELAESCTQGEDIAYRQVIAYQNDEGVYLKSPSSGYAMQQPLNAGINTIEYLDYFTALRNKLIVDQSLGNQTDFYTFYNFVIAPIDGTAFLKKLFDSSLLLYVSQFGAANLFPASLWLFRMTYSLRVSNKKAVKENSIPSFVRDHKVYDLIRMSFSHQELLQRLKRFNYEADENNTAENNTKGRFIARVEAHFNIKVDRCEIKDSYDRGLIKGITAKLGASHG